MSDKRRDRVPTIIKRSVLDRIGVKGAERLLRAYDYGVTQSDLAERFNISEASIGPTIKLLRAKLAAIKANGGQYRVAKERSNDREL